MCKMYIGNIEHWSTTPLHTFICAYLLVKAILHISEMQIIIIKYYFQFFHILLYYYAHCVDFYNNYLNKTK